LIALRQDAFPKHGLAAVVAFLLVVVHLPIDPLFLHRHEVFSQLKFLLLAFCYLLHRLAELLHEALLLDVQVVHLALEVIEIFFMLFYRLVVCQLVTTGLNLFGGREGGEGRLTVSFSCSAIRVDSSLYARACWRT